MGCSSRAFGEEWRNICAFWLFGLFNNMSYVIMLAGATEIASGGVALVYIANVLPSLVMKLTLPYWFHLINYSNRLILCCVLMVSSFFLVSYGVGNLTQQLIGVCLTSVMSGIGEASFLALTAFYETRTTLTAWSSGTGFAGIAGYAWKFIFTKGFNLSFSTMIMIANVIPVCWLISYHFLLGPPTSSDSETPQPARGLSTRDSLKFVVTDNESGRSSIADKIKSLRTSASQRDSVTENSSSGQLSTGERIRYIVCDLWPYIIPLVIVYFAEYAMQSGAWAAIGYPDVHDKAARNSFYQNAGWCYQAGVFVSRSSGLLIQFNRGSLWAMPILQAGFLALFIQDAVHQFWSSVGYGPSLLVACFATGLLGGAVYVNAFTLISKEQPSERKELALTAASIGDSFGIILADVSGLFIQACLYKTLGICGAKASCPQDWATGPAINCTNPGT